MDIARGMQMMLTLAFALSHASKLLILVEPTIADNVVARGELMKWLGDYIEDGQHPLLVSTLITSDNERDSDPLPYSTDDWLHYTDP